MAYDPPTYWTQRGETFADEKPYAEDAPLTAFIDGLHFESVLDLGCGYGRVGDGLLYRHPGISYTGLDVSPKLAELARQRLGQNVITADLATFETACHWDLVLAVSVLGHLLPTQVAAVIERMRSWAMRDVVVWDWDETGAQTDFQFAHDYRTLMPTAERIPVGRMSIYHERML